MAITTIFTPQESLGTSVDKGAIHICKSQMTYYLNFDTVYKIEKCLLSSCHPVRPLGFVNEWNLRPRFSVFFFCISRTSLGSYQFVNVGKPVCSILV